MSRTSEIRAAIQRRYPCQEMPRGAKQSLAIEFGATHQLVQQIAKSLHTVSIKRLATTVQLCGVCGQLVSNSNKSGIHQLCRWIELPCAECGAPVSRRPAHLASRHATGRYTGQVFCNRQCFGRYSGKHWGTGNPDHPVHKQKGASTSMPTPATQA